MTFGVSLLGKLARGEGSCLPKKCELRWVGDVCLTARIPGLCQLPLSSDLNVENKQPFVLEAGWLMRQAFQVYKSYGAANL